MAGTIQLDVSLNVANAPFSFPWSASFSGNQTNRGMSAPLHYLTTSEEVIDPGEVANPGQVILHNIGDPEDPSIIWGPESGGAMVALGRIPPGKFAVWDLNPGTVLRAKAVAGQATFQTYFFEM